MNIVKRNKLNQLFKERLAQKDALIKTEYSKTIDNVGVNSLLESKAQDEPKSKDSKKRNMILKMSNSIHSSLLNLYTNNVTNYNTILNKVKIVKKRAIRRKLSRSSGGSVYQLYCTNSTKSGDKGGCLNILPVISKNADSNGTLM